VELYADGMNGGPPVRQEMTCLHPLADESGGYALQRDRVCVPFTNGLHGTGDASIRSRCNPLENRRILWQR